MPRLLLVDDNPSIHKIAETLLASSDLQLVCAESGRDALARIEDGERFDAALVDTHMAGMDGWELLEALRARPETAALPIALMAGVLDSVDPRRVEAAPIQGFLKKPVELKNLADRVHRLIETPVAPPAPAAAPEPESESLETSPFATLPSVKLEDLPEMRPAGEPEDLLLLTEADILPEEAPMAPMAGQATYEVPVETLGAEEALDLEELDLEGLKDLGLAVEPEPVAPLDVPVPEPEMEVSPLDFTPPAGFQVFTPEVPARLEPLEEPEAAPAEELPDLGPSADLAAGEEDVLDLDAPPPAVEALPADWSDESDSLLDVLQEGQGSATAAVPGPLADEAFEAELDLSEPVLPESPEPALLPGASPAALVPVAPLALPEPEMGVSGTAVSAEALVAALKADPAAMEALAKALVAQMGDQVLREVAWEVLPDLASRLERP